MSAKSLQELIWDSVDGSLENCSSKAAEGLVNEKLQSGVILMQVALNR